MADVFISYHTDSGLATVREIAAALETAGVSCWYANRDVRGGDFAEQIAVAIDECKVFLLLLNAQSNASKDVQNEVKLAYDRNKQKEKIEILPYRIADCRLTGSMRYYLTRFVIIDRRVESITELTVRIAKLLGREYTSTKKAASPSLFSSFFTCPDCSGGGSVIIRRQTPYGIEATKTPCSRCGGKGEISVNELFREFTEKKMKHIT